jgi:hypothetical protein
VLGPGLGLAAGLVAELDAGLVAARIPEGVSGRDAAGALSATRKGPLRTGSNSCSIDTWFASQSCLVSSHLE